MPTFIFFGFAAQFAAVSLETLVDTFNAQVATRAWSSMRAAHDQALMEEFVRRGVDVGAVSDSREND